MFTLSRIYAIEVKIGKRKKAAVVWLTIAALYSCSLELGTGFGNFQNPTGLKRTILPRERKSSSNF